MSIPRSKDPLRGQDGTIRLTYHAVFPSGVTAKCETFTFRMDMEKFERLQAFLTELSEGTPELRKREPRS